MTCAYKSTKAEVGYLALLILINITTQIHFFGQNLQGRFHNQTIMYRYEHLERTLCSQHTHQVTQRDLSAHPNLLHCSYLQRLKWKRYICTSIFLFVCWKYLFSSVCSVMRPDPQANAGGLQRSCTWLWSPVGIGWRRPSPWSNQPSSSAWRRSRFTSLPKTLWRHSLQKG